MFYVTTIRYLTVTHVVTVIEAARSSAKKVLPSYSFIEKDGHTEGLGDKTPPASKSYDIVTSYVTIQPSVDTVTVMSTESTSALILMSLYGFNRVNIFKVRPKHSVALHILVLAKTVGTLLVSRHLSLYPQSKSAQVSMRPSPVPLIQRNIKRTKFVKYCPLELSAMSLLL